MKETKTLSCKFKDTLGTSRLINIDNPKESISTDEINEFMQLVIDSDILVVNDGEPDRKYASISGATITSKTVEELTLV